MIKVYNRHIFYSLLYLYRKHANKEIDTRGRPVKNSKNADTQCDICDKSFDTITATIRHRFKMHPNSPTKFYCSYCGKQFPLRVNNLISLFLFIIFAIILQKFHYSDSQG